MKKATNLNKFITILIVAILAVPTLFAFDNSVRAEATNPVEGKELIYKDNWDWTVYRWIDSDGNARFDVYWSHFIREGEAIAFTPDNIKETLGENYRIIYSVFTSSDHEGTFEKYLEFEDEYTSDTVILTKEEYESYYNSGSIGVFIMFRLESVDERPGQSEPHYTWISGTEYILPYDDEEYCRGAWNIGGFLDDEELEELAPNGIFKSSENTRMFGFNFIVNEHLTGEISASVSIKNNENLPDNLLVEQPIRYITYENETLSGYEDSSIVGIDNTNLITYNIDYSYITVYVELIDIYKFEEILNDIYYIVDFNGVTGETTGRTLEHVIIKDQVPPNRVKEQETTNANPVQETPTIKNPIQEIPTTTESSKKSLKQDSKKVLVKKLKLTAKRKTVKVGKKLKIKAIITPKKASNKKIKWSISRKRYAKINQKGVLTAKKAGKGKIVKVIAKARDGSGKRATIKIKIK